MNLTISPIARSLSKAYLKQSLKREKIELFKRNLTRMFERIRTDEHEEHLKNIVADFLKDTWYKQTNEINTSGRTDLVIHNGKSSADTVGVLLEVKRPGNNNEMISPERTNAKALHELLHYYLSERYLRDNKEIKHLIVCNIYEWYIFDAADFERFFFASKKLTTAYKEWNDGLFGLKSTDWFYQEVARPFIEKELAELPCTHFDLRDFAKIIRKADGEDDKKLIALYKLLSPPHLLKQSFANDANSLNREFYNELLHIIGLEEVKEKGKKLISRTAIARRNDGSLLENAINMLTVQRALEQLDNPEQFGGSEEEQLFSIGLELCITWLNRILFLKLLEGQLITYHQGDRSYAFLKNDQIKDFDHLQELFFEVLARRMDERSPSLAAKFGAIPYLNSSLFEISDLERKTLQISSLKGWLDMPIHGATVLKDAHGKRISATRNTLGYLFDFLDAYDFASEGKADIQETAKTIINASVLGLIFEKINGYRDGSFYTPGFITMYMSREAIRRAVVQKFSDQWGYLVGADGVRPGGNSNESGKSAKNSCHAPLHFDDLVDKLDYSDKVVRQRANDIINSLRLCDPAVGSGHFLVSALNEIISIKSDLHLLTDCDGKRLRGCIVTIENDELIVTVEDELFAYNPKNPESRRIQETLFHEKQTIIEQCLFGVDINPKSVAICRLRLWIELLKNAFYTRESNYTELETLPNIDINIKCGNSLISRFAISGVANVYATERYKLKAITDCYKGKVRQYKLAPVNKHLLRKEIEELKGSLQNFAVPTDPDLLALLKLKNSVDQLGLGVVSEELERYRAMAAREEKLKQAISAKQKTVYANAFEWRFEFPEVLDDEGDFAGFDVVIGNPPYIRQESLKEQKALFAQRFGTFFCGTADIYTYFYKAGLDILTPGGLLCYIAPNKFMRAGYGKNTRQLLAKEATPLLVLDFGDLTIFDEATTYPSIVMVEKLPPIEVNGVLPDAKKKPKAGVCHTPQVQTFLTATFTDPDQLADFDGTIATIGFTMPVSALRADGWSLERPDVLNLMTKLRKSGKPLGEYVGGKIFYGIKTGLNEAFVIDAPTRKRLIAEDPKSAEIIKPWLRGRDIKKWQAEWAELYIIAIACSANREWPWSQAKSEDEALSLFKAAYPAVCKHLEAFAEGLRKRDDQGRFFWELRSCAYYGEFEKEKILYAEISTDGKFLLDQENYFCDTTAYIMGTVSKFLLGLLNSNLLLYMFAKASSEISGGFFRWKRQYIEQLPIPDVPPEKQAPIVALVEQILAAKKSPPPPLSAGGSKTDIPALEAEIDRLVYALYGLTEEEIALVEGKS